MDANDWLKSRPKWTGNCPHCGAIINPAFNLKLLDPCPFCQKPLQTKKSNQSIGYGRQLF